MAGANSVTISRITTNLILEFFTLPIFLRRERSGSKTTTSLENRSLREEGGGKPLGVVWVKKFKIKCRLEFRLFIDYLRCCF